MRGFIVDCFLRASSACNTLSVFFKNCGLMLWKRPDLSPLRGRSSADLIVTKHENIRGQE
ncbi:hypothetical protein FHT78_005460 [Rhizobium sp. BK196]|uniref:hypothetical protein n=1 Tax=Rhizobium sp. BK196 TaxID=2587073 RepID=UPI00161E157F|nr:hypothetical protein [Rhizobium sp. BK196]MBB3313666.1 hypothetical protein [Rhizobium sp. BK196]